MIVVFFPGASLMEIATVDGGLHVRCPGCGNEQIYRGERAADFEHDDGCPVHAQIQQALRRTGRTGSDGFSVKNPFTKGHTE